LPVDWNPCREVHSNSAWRSRKRRIARPTNAPVAARKEPSRRRPRAPVARADIRSSASARRSSTAICREIADGV